MWRDVFDFELNVIFLANILPSDVNILGMASRIFLKIPVYESLSFL